MPLVDKLKRGIAGTAIAAAVLTAGGYSLPKTAQADAEIGNIDPSARLAVLGTNIALMGTICGIAAAAEGRDVIRDAAHCALGATIQYTGMELAMHNAPILPGIGLRLVETGTSMIDNTLAGRGLLDRLSYEFGPLLFTVDTHDGDVEVDWRIVPIVGILTDAAQGYRLNLDDMVNYQTFMFTGDATHGFLSGNQGNTLGDIVMYQDGSTQFRAHEFDHVLQYARARPMQQLVPHVLGFLEEDLHLRIGEDTLMSLLNAPQTICHLAGGELCGRQVYNIQEDEAYTMMTGNEGYTPVEFSR